MRSQQHQTPDEPSNLTAEIELDSLILLFMLQTVLTLCLHESGKLPGQTVLVKEGLSDSLEMLSNNRRLSGVKVRLGLSCAREVQILFILNVGLHFLFCCRAQVGMRKSLRREMSGLKGSPDI